MSRAAGGKFISNSKLRKLGMAILTTTLTIPSSFCLASPQRSLPSIPRNPLPDRLSPELDSRIRGRWERGTAEFDPTTKKLSYRLNNRVHGSVTIDFPEGINVGNLVDIVFSETRTIIVTPDHAILMPGADPILYTDPSHPTIVIVPDLDVLSLHGTNGALAAQNPVSAAYSPDTEHLLVLAATTGYVWSLDISDSPDPRFRAFRGFERPSSNGEVFSHNEIAVLADHKSIVLVDYSAPYTYRVSFTLDSAGGDISSEVTDDRLVVSVGQNRFAISVPNPGELKGATIFSI